MPNFTERIIFPENAAFDGFLPYQKQRFPCDIDGVGIEKIRIAEVQRMDALDEAIQEVMSR